MRVSVEKSGEKRDYQNEEVSFLGGGNDLFFFSFYTHQLPSIPPFRLPPAMVV